MGKNVNKNRNRRSQSYSLMFIGSDGTLKEIRWAKFLLTLLLFLLTSAIVTASTFYILYDQKYREAALLKHELYSLEQQQLELQSRFNQLHGKTGSLNRNSSELDKKTEPAVKIVNTAQPQIQHEIAPEEKVLDIIDHSEDTKGEGGSEELSSEAQQLAAAVDTAEFDASIGRGRRELNIRLNIVNNSREIGQISGHVIVVVKPSINSERGWVVSPSMGLVNGRPTGNQLGQTFSISRFRTLYFKVNTVSNPEHYTVATVYVFTRDGELLLEKDYPLALN